MNDLITPNQFSYSAAATALLYPIADSNPAGEEQAYSTLFDDIREARRAEDAGLAQGQWQTEVKTASWSTVRNLCEIGLKERTKDFQLSTWYAEALVYLDGFAGLTLGLEVLHGLISVYWDSAYPKLDNADLDERIGKIEWLNSQLATALRQIPMTRREHGGYSWLHWQESRWVENVGLRDMKAKADAIADGKLSGELFDKAAKESGASFYENVVRETRAASNALELLLDAISSRFGIDAPSLAELKQSLSECAQLANRLHGELSGGITLAVEESGTINQAHLQDSTNSAVGVKTVGSLQSRTDAIQTLRDVARYFRVNEPHSPVALLAERAARWAEMSVDEWLRAVIKDEGTLGQLHELLDIKTES